MNTRFIQEQIKQGKITSEDIDFLSRLDPTENKGYTLFIVKSYLTGANLDSLRNRISEYYTLQSRYPNNIKNLYSFRTFKQFDEYVEKYNNVPSHRAFKREIKKEADVILANEELFIVSPHSHEASCLFGAGTKWCTTTKNGVHFDSYYQNLITFYYIQVRSPILRRKLKQDLWKVALVVFPDGELRAFDAVDHLIGGDKDTAYEADKLNNFLTLLGVSRMLFRPRDMDERLADYLLYKKLDTDINLSGLGLTRIPDAIGDMVQLKSLILSENRLQAIPESIGMLTNLKILYLFHNKITSLPESIGTMKELQWLGLRGNPISRKTIRELKSKLPNTRIYAD